MSKSTLVEVTCTARTERQNYDPANPKQYSIELSVPYKQDNIFFQMSGGTNMQLNTINKEAADQFEIGGVYEMVISRKES